MPTSISAKKRVRQSLKRRSRNRVYRTHARRELKKARLSLEGAEAAAAEAAVAGAARTLDKVASKGIVHRRKVARLKSRLARKLNSLKAKLAPPA